MAYNFWRKLRTEGKAGRFVLVKGEGKPGQPRARVSFPDSSRRDQTAIARGDVPVLMLNSNLIKDMLDSMLDCLMPGKGMYRLPDWLPDRIFAELCAEIRTSKGWEHTSGRGRNEAVDLSYYAIGLCVSEFLRLEKLDWSNPPGWAADWDKNELVRTPVEEPRFANPLKSNYDFSGFARALA